MGRGDGGAAATPRGGGHTGVDSRAPTSAPGRRGAQHSLLASLWRRVAVPSTLKLAVLAGCYVIGECIVWVAVGTAGLCTFAACVLL